MNLLTKLNLCFFVAMLIASGCKEKEYTVVKADSKECIQQCSRSFWKKAFDEQKYPACKELHGTKPCCVYETVNSCSGPFCSGDSWQKGQRERMTACKE